MLYRLRIDLAFGDKTQANALHAHARTFIHFAQTIDPGIPTMIERGFITLEECHHDEDPLAPCTILANQLTP